MTASHVALVLAAGGSARLGQPKQLLTRDGETLVHRAVRLAIGSGAAQTFVVVGAHAHAIAAALAGTHYTLLANPHWQAGLASSLRCAAPQVAAAGAPVLILGCDQPGLEAAHLADLVQHARAAASRCAATDYGAGAGLPAVVPAAWFGAMAGVDGDRGFRARFHALGDALARVPAPQGLALDIDDAADLAQARALGLVDPPA
jgi:molybdenum cofactor cytidylyltransferase